MDWGQRTFRGIPSTTEFLLELERDGLLPVDDSLTAELILSRLSGAQVQHRTVAMTRCEESQYHALLLLDDDSLRLLHHAQADDLAEGILRRLVGQAPQNRCLHAKLLWSQALAMLQGFDSLKTFDYREFARVTINLPEALQVEARERRDQRTHALGGAKR